MANDKATVAKGVGKLEDRRKALGLTLGQLAGKAGLSASSLQRWEKGQAQPHPLNYARVDAVLAAEKEAASAARAAEQEAALATLTAEERTLSQAGHHAEPNSNGVGVGVGEGRRRKTSAEADAVQSQLQLQGSLIRYALENDLTLRQTIVMARIANSLGSHIAEDTREGHWRKIHASLRLLF